MKEPPSHRPIRSFVRREGRMTGGQRRALEQLLPRFGLDPQAGVWDLRQAFGREAPRFADIGFGAGESLLKMARTRPEHDFIGVEVHRPGVGRLLLELERAGLTNVRVVCADAVEVLSANLAPGSLSGAYLFFPDPWHKKRHHKRRLVRPEFVHLVSTRLAIGGRLHMATDWEDYAQHMLTLLNAEATLVNAAADGPFARRGERPQTKYEQRGERLGHRVRDLVFERGGDRK